MILTPAFTAGLSVLETTDLVGFSHTAVSRIDIEFNTFLLKEVGREWQDLCELTGWLQ